MNQNQTSKLGNQDGSIESKQAGFWVVLFVLILAGAVFAGLGETFSNTLSFLK